MLPVDLFIPALLFFCFSIIVLLFGVDYSISVQKPLSFRPCVTFNTVKNCICVSVPL